MCPAKGGREKKMTKVTYICCSAKKNVVTCSLFYFIFSSNFSNAFFGRFATRGVKKRDKKNRAEISSAPTPKKRKK
jgi:hypothetical protein